MVFDPVKYGGTEDEIESVGKREFKQVALLNRYTLSKFLERGTSLAHHVLGFINGKHMAQRKLSEQFCGHASGSAAGIKDTLGRT